MEIKLIDFLFKKTPQTTAATLFQMNCCSSILSTSRTSLHGPDHMLPLLNLSSPSSGGIGNQIHVPQFSQVCLFQINLGHPVIINLIELWRGFTIQLALGVFRYIHISPAFITLILLLKILSDHPCNPISLLPVTVINKLVFQHEDNISQIIIHGDFIEVESAVIIRSSQKTQEWLWWLAIYCNKSI